MSNDARLVTICKPKSRAEFLIIEGLLNSAGIEYFSLNEGVQDLYGGLNIVSQGYEIQVSEENFKKANELIQAEPQLNNQV